MARRGQGKYVLKKTKKRKRGSNKTIVSLVKKAVMKQVETKTLDFSASSTIKHGNQLSWNIMYQIGNEEGVGEHQFVGGKYVISGISIKGTVNNSFSGGAALNHGTFWNVFLVATKTYRTTTSLSSTDILDSHVGINNAVITTFDPDKCKVLASRKIYIPPMGNAETATPNQSNGGIQLKRFKIYKKLNKPISFIDWTNSYELKNQNYYVLVQNFNAAGVADTTTSVNFAVRLYIKDA